MGKEFEIRRVCSIEAAPQQVWDTITTGAAGWLWPVEYEPRVGGAASMGVVTFWEPPTHFAARMEGGDGWFNNLDYVIEASGDGGAILRYVHSGIFVDNWDDQYDGASKHTDFYLHTLGQCAQHFAGRRAAYISIDGPAASASSNAMTVLAVGLGLSEDVNEHGVVPLDLPGISGSHAIVDYRTENFLGIRTSDAMYRFFGRSAWGGPVSLSQHLFADDVDVDKSEQVWGAWLNQVFEEAR